jgi:peptidoglycan/LPS O-acetylase OafA/YrhL
MSWFLVVLLAFVALASLPTVRANPSRRYVVLAFGAAALGGNLAVLFLSTDRDWYLDAIAAALSGLMLVVAVLCLYAAFKTRGGRPVPQEWSIPFWRRTRHVDR